MQAQGSIPTNLVPIFTILLTFVGVGVVLLAEYFKTNINLSPAVAAKRTDPDNTEIIYKREYSWSSVCENTAWTSSAMAFSLLLPGATSAQINHVFVCICLFGVVLGAIMFLGLVFHHTKVGSNIMDMRVNGRPEEAIKLYKNLNATVTCILSILFMSYVVFISLVYSGAIDFR